MTGAKLSSLCINLLRPAPEGLGAWLVPRALEEAKRHQITGFSGQPWDLFIRPPSPDPPNWAKFFQPHIPEGAFGDAASCGALLIVPAEGRTFAITFGTGRHLLRDGAKVENFGLRIVLNAVDAAKLRSIDKETLDHTVGHSRFQAPREVSTEQFGLDPERDLLRSVTGSPEDESLGTTITGKDALYPGKSLGLGDLPDFLERALFYFSRTDYQAKFPWVDNLKAISDPTIIQYLDEELLVNLHTANKPDTWLAPPEIIDRVEIAGFSYTKSPRVLLPDIHWSTFLDFLESNGDRLDIETLKRRRVFLWGSEARFKGQWSVYNCAYAEISDGSEVYVLSNGRWYEVTPSFRQDIAAFFAGIEMAGLQLPIFSEKAPDEGHYNSLAASESNGTLALMDKVPIPGYGNMEFCDLFSRDNDFIHVKRFRGSKDLSHLFAQGFNSGEAFRLDAKFRQAVLDRLPRSHKEALAVNLSPDRMPRIVFAIISRSEGPLTLPFFSQISLKHAAERLRAYGYGIAVQKIEMTELARKLTKARPRGRKP